MNPSWLEEKTEVTDKKKNNNSRQSAKDGDGGRKIWRIYNRRWKKPFWNYEASPSLNFHKASIINWHIIFLRPDTPKSDSEPYSSLWSGFQFLTQIHNCVSCTDTTLLIKYRYKVFLCALIAIPWTVNSHELLKAPIPHVTVAVLKEVKGGNRFDNGVSPFGPRVVKPNHSNDKNETVWKISHWQESWKYPAFTYIFPSHILLIEITGFHSTIHTEGALLHAKPSLVPCRWKRRKTQSLIPRLSLSESTTWKQSSEKQS